MLKCQPHPLNNKNNKSNNRRLLKALLKVLKTFFRPKLLRLRLVKQNLKDREKEVKVEYTLRKLTSRPSLLSHQSSKTFKTSKRDLV